MPGLGGFAALLAVGACLAALVAPSVSVAAYGDAFGVDDLNGPGFESAPAFPGAKAFWAGSCRLSEADAEVGTAPAVRPDCLDFGVVNQGLTLNQWTTPPAWRLEATTQAGAHPDGTATFWLRRNNEWAIFTSEPDGNAKSIRVELPAGLLGDTTAVPLCPAEAVRQVPTQCEPASQVGMATIYALPWGSSRTDIRPVYLAEPRRGKAVELVISKPFDETNQPIVGNVRTSGDFGVDALALNLPTGYPVIASQVTLWGVPWAAIHDPWRAPQGFNAPGIQAQGLPPAGLPADQRQSYNASWGPIKPFVLNPTECASVPPIARLHIDSWQKPGQFETTDSPAPLVDGCEKVPFEPQATFQPTSSEAGGASGLSVDLTVPQNDEPPADVAADPSAAGAPAHWASDAGLATAQLDKAVVTLPAGLTVNPAAAAGLSGCSDAQIALGSDDAPSCPEGSRIGTAEVVSPLLRERLEGDVILGQPRSTDPQSGEMLRLFLVLRNDERGLLVKVAGSAVADPETGRLTATFDDNPRVQFEKLHLEFKGGPRGVLALPQDCGTHSTSAVFTPWTAGGGGSEAPTADAFSVSGDCARFAPALQAGNDNRRASESGTFSFKLSREDGDRWLRGLTAELPQGLLASVRDVPLCADAQAAAGACPAASRIGSVDASAGAGDPFVLEEKGDVYLTEGYKGGAYGLMVKVRAIAGPFRGDLELSPIVVRQAIHVDRSTAQVTAVSDPFPIVHHGIPLRIRDVTVLVDRGGFMRNPTDCSPSAVEAQVTSVDGRAADLSNPFQVSGCAALPFKPRLALRVSGRRQVTTGKHPGVRAQVNQAGIGEAGIEKAVVRLPKSLALDPENAQALCEFEDGTKPDLENHCPKGSIVGRARAKTPLLKDDLVGNVYFVKNVKRSPTGNLIRTLPMIIVALRGEIAVNLKGESSTMKDGRLVNTFASVPDAPISQFNLNIAGGKNGILAVTRTRKALINLCAGRHVAEADMDGQNGRRHDRDIRMKTPCTKRQSKRAKRAATKAKRAAREASRRS